MEDKIWYAFFPPSMLGGDGCELGFFPGSEVMPFARAAAGELRGMLKTLVFLQPQNTNSLEDD